MWPVYTPVHSSASDYAMLHLLTLQVSVNPLMRKQEGIGRHLIPG